MKKNTNILEKKTWWTNSNVPRKKSVQRIPVGWIPAACRWTIRQAEISDPNGSEHLTE